MTAFEELFRDYWWLLFPLFGMFMAIWGMSQSERRARNVMDLIASYAEQGKEPPPELLRIAAKSLDAEGAPETKRDNRAWHVVTPAALAAGFGVAWYMVQAEDWAWVLALVAVTMGVIALGALAILLFSRN